GTFTQQVQIEGRAALDGENIAVFQRIVTDDAFRALGVPLLQGRAFGSSDVRGGTRVALVNQTLAAGRLAGARPVGQRLLPCNRRGCHASSPLAVVGGVRDVRCRGREQGAGAEG